MADQSNLTIGGIGGDPSGSHPIGNFNTNWTITTEEAALLYTAGTIMADPGAQGVDCDVTFYSEILCVGPLVNGILLEIGNTGDTQCKALWQWYNPATSGKDADFVMAADGKAGTFGNGTWTDIGTAGVSYTDQILIGNEGHVGDDDSAAMAKGAMLRVRLNILDDDSGGVAEAIVTAAVDAVNGATCGYPVNKTALYNKPIVVGYSGQAVSGSIGGIGVDPS